MSKHKWPFFFLLQENQIISRILYIRHRKYILIGENDECEKI